MKMTALSIFCLGGMMFFASGCYAPVAPEVEHHCDPLAQHLQFEHHYDDHRLAAQVGVVRTMRARNDEGFLRVLTILENYTDERLAIHYKVEWSDEQSTAVAAEEVWNQLIFEPRECHHLVFTAPTRSVEGFCLRVGRPE